MKKQESHASTNGWTLVEMLVVLVLVAFLATLAIPNLQVPLERSRALEREQLLLEAMARLLSQVDDGQQSSPQDCLGIASDLQRRISALDMQVDCYLSQEGELVLQATGDFKFQQNR